MSSSTGWRGYPGQQFAQGDLPRSDLKSNIRSVDFDSKSAKSDYVRVQGNNIARGGGAGFPVQGEQHFTEFVNGDTAWNLNAQGQPVRQSAVEAGDRQLALWTNPIGFIKAGLAATNAAATDHYYGRTSCAAIVIACSSRRLAFPGNLQGSAGNAYLSETSYVSGWSVDVAINATAIVA